MESIFVGIDLAKATIEVVVPPDDNAWQVSYDDAGI